MNSDTQNELATLATGAVVLVAVVAAFVILGRHPFDSESERRERQKICYFESVYYGGECDVYGNRRGGTP